MSPDKRDKRRGGGQKGSRGARAPRVPGIPAPITAPSSDDAHDVVYFARANGSVPGKTFLDDAPVKVRALMRAVVVQVATAPPKRFAGGGYWEAMHGDMTGWYEVRVDGPGKKVHYRLFCRLDYEAQGRGKPLLVIVTGLSKPVGTVLSDEDYARVRDLWAEYLRSNPRSVL